MAVENQGRVGVEEQVAQARDLSRRERRAAGGHGDVHLRRVVERERAGDGGRRERVQQGATGQPHVEGSELGGRPQQDGGRFAGWFRALIDLPLRPLGQAVVERVARTVP